MGKGCNTLADIDERYEDAPRRKAHGESKYVYPKRKPIRMTMFMLAILLGIVGGGAVGVVAWKLWLQPTQHHMMYPNEAEDVAAQWVGVPVVISSDLADVVRQSSYYGTPEYKAMLPEERENGSIVFNPKSGSDMYAFVRLIRDEIDRLIETNKADTSLVFFEDAKMNIEYDILTVTTPMERASLVDEKVSDLLLSHMKVQALLYHPGEDTIVVIQYVNDQSGKTVTAMQK